MTGVSVCQWRISVGIFNLLSMYIKCVKGSNKLHRNEKPSNIFVSFFSILPTKLLFGFLVVFAYCLMIILFLSIFLMLYPHINLFCDGTFKPFSRTMPPFANYFVYVFSKITLFPFNVYALCRNTILLFRYHFSEKAKKIIVFYHRATDAINYFRLS